jgi:2-polyprenyl-3-methyl-5-hydroxy-6-metoxy-1,4-benzoquinol methylase
MSILSELKDFIPIFNLILQIGIVGIVFRLSSHSRQALIDKHQAELAAKDTNIQALTGQLQFLDARLKLSQDHCNVLERMQKLVVPEHRADPALSDDSYDIIPLAHVVEFYDAIAPFYNKRNTGKYLATYTAIYGVIESSFESLEGITICDLGGGTGFLLNRFQHHGAQWTNVDISLGALAVFQSEFSFYHHKWQRNLDICTDSFIKQNEQFDVLVMSYLLSSLDRCPDFAQIHLAMHEHSLLVVADNHFEYVHKNPYYGYRGIDGRNLAIAPRPMVPEEIQALVEEAGFVKTGYMIVSIDGNEPYSQVHVFKRASPSP